VTLLRVSYLVALTLGAGGCLVAALGLARAAVGKRRTRSAAAKIVLECVLCLALAIGASFALPTPGAALGAWVMVGLIAQGLTQAGATPSDGETRDRQARGSGRADSVAGGSK
jgi:hypothetical protein